MVILHFSLQIKNIKHFKKPIKNKYKVGLEKARKKKFNFDISIYQVF